MILLYSTYLRVFIVYLQVIPMLKTTECVCHRCGKKQTITVDDSEKWIRETSRVLGVTVHFKSEFVYKVAIYEKDHWLSHRKEDMEKEKELNRIS